MIEWRNAGKGGRPLHSHPHLEPGVGKRVRVSYNTSIVDWTEGEMAFLASNVAETEHVTDRKYEEVYVYRILWK